MNGDVRRVFAVSRFSGWILPALYVALIAWMIANAAGN